MKSIIKFSYVCLMAIFLFTFTACKEDSDTTKPVINLIEPENGDILQIGDAEGVHFDVEFSDNEMLASYKVDIHPNFDNHSHATTKSEDTTVDFRFEKTWTTISGKKNDYVHHHEIKIPENATPGHYHLMLYCTDAAGNESYVARDVELSHEAGEDHDHDHDD
ncbi:MAG: DUF4625 domain-containing protein [Prevotellaceae bacterium]|jgi:hypothetical protein|nr:DUF4625 domain-containing protein [Prevotellaceae bacterium]